MWNKYFNACNKLKFYLRLLNLFRLDILAILPYYMGLLISDPSKNSEVNEGVRKSSNTCSMGRIYRFFLPLCIFIFYGVLLYVCFVFIVYKNKLHVGIVYDIDYWIRSGWYIVSSGMLFFVISAATHYHHSKNIQNWRIYIFGRVI